MQCTQLIRLIKDWYLHVKEETMAPARMLQFTDKHIKSCDVCMQDPGLTEEIEKIREFVLPESKIPKSKRGDEEEATPEISPAIDEGENKKSGTEPDNNNDQDAKDKN
jgi:hypothetical protein